MAAIILYLGHDLGQDRQDLTIYLAQEISQDTQEFNSISCPGFFHCVRNLVVVTVTVLSFSVSLFCCFVVVFGAFTVGIYSGLG